MKDPVILSDGFSYEKVNIDNWFADGKKVSPKTTKQLETLSYTSNHVLREVILHFTNDMVMTSTTRNSMYS